MKTIAFLLFYSVIVNAQGITQQRLSLDQYEMIPTPELQGFSNGNTQIDIHLESSTYTSPDSVLTLQGSIRDHETQEGVAGVRLVLGPIDTLQNSPRGFAPRFSVLADDQGNFSLRSHITQSDVLVITWLGYAERVFSLRRLVSEP